MLFTNFLYVFLAFHPVFTTGDRPEIKQDTDDVVASIDPSALLNVSSWTVKLHDLVVWSQCSFFKKKTAPDIGSAFLRDTLPDSTYYIVRQYVGDENAWENPDPKLCNAKLLKVVGGTTSFTPTGTDVTLHSKYFVSEKGSQIKFKEHSIALMDDKSRNTNNVFTTQGGLPYWFKSGVVMIGAGSSASNEYFHTFEQLTNSLSSKSEEVQDAYQKWEAQRNRFGGTVNAWLKLASTVDHTSSPMYPGEGQIKVPTTPIGDLSNWKWVTCGTKIDPVGSDDDGLRFDMESGSGRDANFHTLYAGTGLSFPGCRSQTIEKDSFFVFDGNLGEITQHTVILHMEYEVLPGQAFWDSTKTFVKSVVAEDNVVFALVGSGGTWNGKEFYHWIMVFKSYNAYVTHSETSKAFRLWAKTRETDRVNGGWLKQSTSVNLVGSPLYDARR